MLFDVPRGGAIIPLTDKPEAVERPAREVASAGEINAEIPPSGV
jgi:hypothetical protein